ncbi:DUF1569 domain-containing protein [Pontibacter populi]|uniref:DUF1569 domain-containing protein n=1 Tax=Pontibacter populi TaxID=890055 RepID=A0ABV1RXP9_9BACT
MNSVFNPATTEELITRIHKLQKYSRPLWGKMNVAQMLAHCNVTYELVYEDKHPKPNPIMKFLAKLFVKDFVVNEKPFKQNVHSAPHFKIVDTKEFETEKSRLITYLQKTQQLGQSYFEGKESHSFGPLNSSQWNNMFYKHLNHHLSQFGV